MLSHAAASSPARPTPHAGRPVGREDSSRPGGVFPFRKRARCKVTAINRDHTVGRMALAIVTWVETHGTMVEGNLTGFGFSWDEITRHKAEAFRIAKSFKPELFRSWADFGC